MSIGFDNFSPRPYNGVGHFENLPVGSCFSKFFQFFSPKPQIILNFAAKKSVAGPKLGKNPIMAPP